MANLSSSLASDVLAAPLPSREGATPMMAQYLDIKHAYSEYLVFFRMGDFYELFFEDALITAKALNLNLTHRGKHNGMDIPMCGVPFHAVDTYRAKLIFQGYRVAICEQTTTPADHKSGKSILKREVVRIITPGTLTEENLLESDRHNFLVAIAPSSKNNLSTLGVVYIDISTGDFFVEIIPTSKITSLLTRLSPSEILIPYSLDKDPSLREVLTNWRRALNPLPDTRFDLENGQRRLESAFAVKTLSVFGEFKEEEIRACGALFDYVMLTQHDKLPHLNPPQRVKAEEVMDIDAATYRNLEVMQTLSGKREGSLYTVINHTLTHAGGRLLAHYLATPLAEKNRIEQRLRSVDFFVNNSSIRENVRAHLKNCPDLERALARVTIGRCSPRDLATIREGLKVGRFLFNICNDVSSADKTSFLPLHNFEPLNMHDVLIHHLEQALTTSLPVFARDGNFIASGYSAELDELRTLRDQSQQHLDNLQQRYQQLTGVNGLKIRHNNILGYYIEVTTLHATKLPTDIFIHRQTLSNNGRFTTLELNELEKKINQAKEFALDLELRLFEDLISEVKGCCNEIAHAAQTIARLDVASALANLAVKHHYCRPIVDESLEFTITVGRHPVVETTTDNFVPNECILNEENRLWLITGPNMAGKSTFMRQNALIALLAHIGSYVPAKTAHIGIVDRLFSRVGASDDLARGHSTFMVEMIETATILHQATSRSLVILDEVGRGTATLDGMAIAWAVVEQLQRVNKCRGFFATHFHELTHLQTSLPNLGCYTMKVKEWQNKIIFLHQIMKGTADRSYGLHVAQMAGLPATVVKRASHILQELEASHTLKNTTLDLPLFNQAPKEKEALYSYSPVIEKLHSIDLDHLTPRQAHDFLYEIFALAKSSS